MFRKQYVLAAIAVLAVAASAGCGHSSQPDSAGSQVKAVASSTAIAQAKAKFESQINSCVDQVGLTHLVTKKGRTTLVHCLESIVPQAKRTRFENCLSTAAETDKIWTKAGRVKFESADGPACVNAAA
ncbi:MAG TPA: hypothetical protein VGG75_34190 [Trebonia sp.]|jgi:hypothetical protein